MAPPPAKRLRTASAAAQSSAAAAAATDERIEADMAQVPEPCTAPVLHADWAGTCMQRNVAGWAVSHAA